MSHKKKKSATVAVSRSKKSFKHAFAVATRPVVRLYATLRSRKANFLLRRPHRSFRKTKRRDYARSLKLPGYFAFTIEVTQLLWRHRLMFLLLAIIYIVLMLAFQLLGSQDTYTQFRELLGTTEPEGLLEGVTGEFGRAGLLLMSIISAGLSGELSESQQIAGVFLGLYMWMTVVWLLRNILAGKKVTVRDGIYSAGAPTVSTFLMFFILLVQLLPAAFAVIIVSAGLQSGFISQGAPAMAAGLGLALIVIASLYWVVSTFIALVVITLPGMYPFRALTIAGDLVIGRRLRLLLRVVWLALTVVSWWVVIMIPIIILDGALKHWFEQIAWMPIVPVAVLLMATFTIIWVSTYIYLLYRKVVDDDASPA